jgi:hypothetical protein
MTLFLAISRQLKNASGLDIDVFIDNRYKFSVSHDEDFQGNFFDDCIVLRVETKKDIIRIYAE